MQHGVSHDDMEPGVMMAQSPSRVPWVYSASMLLGIWLVTTPFTLDLGSRALAWSDALSGVLVLCIAGLTLLLPRRHSWVFFGVAAVGIWLLLAPLFFWSPTAAGYLNDTLVGAMLITFAVIVPMGMPMGGPETPPGWTYNPSSWPQRAPVIALGLVGFFISRYLTAYQLGHIDSAWDPFFGGSTTGTEAVLDSDVSRMWPISDAGLGAVTYLLEVLSGFMGDRKRWRTMPWMVAMFGVLVVPLGIVSTVLIMLQPLAVGTWCTLCLVSAAAMAVMIPLTLDEVVAMLQFMSQKKREGVGYWHTFWYGGTPAGAVEGQEEIGTARAWSPREMLRGFTVTWQMSLCTALGIWMLFAPSVVGCTGAMADSSILVGALVVIASLVAMAEVGRPARWLNLVFGAWLIAAVWFLDGGTTGGRINAAVVGLVISLASIPLGTWHERYGRAERAAKWTPLKRTHHHARA